MSHSAFFTLTNQKRQLPAISMGIFNDEIHTVAGQGERGPPGIGFTLTSNGDFDIRKKRLTSVGSPKKASDSTTKEYVDQNDMYRSIHTKNEFLLTSSDFSTDGSFLVFVFGKYPDYSRKYHNTHSHVACSPSRSPGQITVNLGRLAQGIYGLRVEAITDPKIDSGGLDLVVNHNSDTTLKYKEKLEQNVCVTDTHLVENYETNTRVIITVHYVDNKEIPLFIFGRRGEGYVDPQLLDNLSYGEMIRIPRYKSLETGGRRCQILVLGSFKDVAGYPKENLVSYLYDSESRNLLWKFNRIYSGIGEFYFQFSFPCLICLDGLTLRQKLNESLGTWMLRFFNEKTGIWEDLRDIAFAWNAPDDIKAARTFRLVHMTGDLHIGISLKSITFVTKAITYKVPP